MAKFQTYHFEDKEVKLDFQFEETLETKSQKTRFVKMLKEAVEVLESELK